MLKIAFRKLTDDSPAIGRLICAVTGGNIYHAAILTPDERMLAAECPQGVMYSTPGSLDPNEWDIIDVAIDWTPKLQAFCDSKVDDAYDFESAFLSGIGEHVVHPGKEMCSELAQMVLTEGGMEIPPVSPTPVELRNELASRHGIMACSCKKRPLLRPTDYDYLTRLAACGHIDWELAGRITAHLSR